MGQFVTLALFRDAFFDRDRAQEIYQLNSTANSFLACVSSVGRVSSAAISPDSRRCAALPPCGLLLSGSRQAGAFHALEAVRGATCAAVGSRLFARALRCGEAAACNSAALPCWRAACRWICTFFCRTLATEEVASRGVDPKRIGSDFPLLWNTGVLASAISKAPA